MTHQLHLCEGVQSVKHKIDVACGYLCLGRNEGSPECPFHFPDP